MKLLQVITGLQKAAGTSTFCGEVCNQLAALGHDVTIAICDPLQHNLYSLNPRIHLVSLDFIFHSSTSTCNFNLVHIHGLWSPILHKASNWAHAHGIPVVWSTHGMTAPWAMRHKWWKKCLPWYLYQKRDLKRARMIHCTSDFEIEWNKEIGFERTFIAPLGTFLPEIDERCCDRKRDKCLNVGIGECLNKKLGASEGCRSTAEDKLRSNTLLFVGRIYPVKALDRLIEAFGNAEKQRSRDGEWILRIVGPDQAGHTAELMALCEKLEIPYSAPHEYIDNAATRRHLSSSPMVQFVGPKYGQELEWEYANCTALALVSHTENFGATVVDAMAHGKPVITSTKTPWKMTADKHCGWWIDNDVASLSRALIQLFKLSNTELIAMGSRGRELIEARFAWQAIAQTVGVAYKDAQYDCKHAPCGTCEKCYDTCSPERIIH